MSKDVIKLDQLIRIAEVVPWETFEAMHDGRLLLQDRAQTLVSNEEDVSPLLWVFEMRVGLHFERPMQAIMSCGQFVRMRSWDSELYQTDGLSKLDPEHPGACLYQYAIHPQQQWQTVPTAFTWRPQQNLQGLTGGQSGGLGNYPQNMVWLGPGQTVTTANTSVQTGFVYGLASALGVKI